MDGHWIEACATGRNEPLQITKTLANCTQMDTISKSDVVLVKKSFVSVHVASEHV